MPYSNLHERDEIVNDGTYRSPKDLKKALVSLLNNNFATDVGRGKCAAAIQTILTPPEDNYFGVDRRFAAIRITDGISQSLLAAHLACQHKSRGVYNTDRTSAVQNTGSNTSGKQISPGTSGPSNPAPGPSSTTTEQITMIDWTKEDSAIVGIERNIAAAISQCAAGQLGYFGTAKGIEDATKLIWSSSTNPSGVPLPPSGNQSPV
jgi:hypothetical protein